jgi:hypothetical protein
MVRPRRFTFLFAVAIAPLAVIIACSDPPNRPPAGGDGTVKVPGAGGGAEGGGGEGGIDGGADANGVDASPCNADLVLTGQIVDRIGVTGEPPVATGGVIMDGTYDLTALSVYVGISGVGGPTGITARSTINITAPRIDQVLELGGAGKTPTQMRRSSTYGVSGAQFATTEICPTGQALSRQFTVTGSTLVLTDLLTKEEFTFTKR